MSQSDASLESLLLKSREFGCEYENALSNHLPMALRALMKIGASAEQQNAFYSQYAPHLEKISEDDGRIDRKSWTNYLGQHRFNQSYRNFFLGEIESFGFEKVIETFLPTLVRGVSGGAFHPLIRLGYSIESSDDWETAEALASWCMAYQPLGEVPSPTLLRSPISHNEQFELLAKEVQRNPVHLEGDTVFAYFKCVADSQAFMNAFSPTLPEQLSIAKIADTALKLYLSTNDSFTALHCVTATHALRLVSPFLKNSNLNNYLWQAVCATYVIVKCPRMVGVTIPSALPSWDEIFEAARNQFNDHVIKFTYTSFSEFETYQNPLYQFAAAKKTALL